MSAPVASGWSGRRVGLAPTGKAPPCHGARGKPSFGGPGPDEEVAADSRRSVLVGLQLSSGRRLSFWRAGSGPDCGYLVVSRIIESGRKPPNTRPEAVVVLESMNPLPNILIIHERSRIFFLQNIKLASVAAYCRAG
jgi:hypothetical protein